jgi:Protein of unknown function (DUF1176)
VITALIIPALSLLTQSAAGFVVGDLKEFGDWVVGCDNDRDCHATSLPISEDGTPTGEGELTIAIKRDGNIADPPTVEFVTGLPDEEARTAEGIAIDGKRLDFRLDDGASAYFFERDASTKLVGAMRGKGIFALHDRDGKAIATASLRGLPEVLKYIDQRQYLTGTAAALVPPVSKPSDLSKVPLFRLRRQIVVAPRSDIPPITIDATQLTKLRSLDPCLKYSKDVTPGPPSYYRLDNANTLMILPTTCGGYNPYSMLYIVDEKGRGQPARFWSYPGNDMKDDEGLTDVWWDEQARLLSSFGRGRGVADCGVSQDYAWYKGKFMLVDYQSMQPCRGSFDFITTYRIDVTIDDSPPKRKAQ